MPTAPALFWSPWVTVVLVGAAGRLFVRFQPAAAVKGKADPERARIPLRAVIAVGAVLVIGVVLAGALLPVRLAAWRPPAVVEQLRRLGALLGFTCFVVTVAWLVWGQIRRSHRGLRAGFLARASLPVAARAFLAISVLSAGMLLWNWRNDGQHQRAFAAAAADPISDRLGAGAADVLKPD
jgi:Na+/proline symporter